MTRPSSFVGTVVVASLALIAGAACASNDEGLSGVSGGDAASEGGSGIGVLLDGGAPDTPSLTPRPDAPIVDKAPPPDTAPPVTTSMGVGLPCQNDASCMAGLTCLNEAYNWPNDGYCTVAGCIVDGDCGDDAFCSPAIGNQKTRICIKRCDGAGACARNRQCAQRLSGVLDLGQKGCVPANVAAGDGDACKGFGDCQAIQVCLRNPFSFPGGECITVGCTPGDNTTCASRTGGFCVPVNNVGLCLHTCQKTAECREKEGYICADPDGNGAVPSLCLYGAMETGDACKQDIDCGPAGSPWECLTGNRFPGGYCGARGCTLGMESTCPSSSLCFDPDPGRVNDQFCVRTCTTDAQCRAQDGYHCRPLSDTAGAPKGCLL